MARTKAARLTYNQQIHYVKTRKITSADDGVAVETDNKIPAGCLIIKPLSGFMVNVAFDGSAVVDAGPTTNDDLWATDLATGTIAFVPFDEAVTMEVGTTDVQPIFTMSGGTVTVGEGYGVVAYIKL
jgi:hypothetical protein